MTEVFRTIQVINKLNGLDITYRMNFINDWLILIASLKMWNPLIKKKKLNLCPLH